MRNYFHLELKTHSKVAPTEAEIAEVVSDLVRKKIKEVQEMSGVTTKSVETFTVEVVGPLK